MVAGGLPTVQVLLDDGTGTFPFDITTYVRMVEGIKFTRGRQDESSSPTPGTFSLVLDNTDGRFTVGSTIIATPSPIKMDQKIRVNLTANATTVTAFTQTVQNWPTEWPDGGDLFSIAQISGTDMQSQAERQTLRSVIEEEILLDSPAALYMLGEPAGSTTAVDASGNQAPALTMAGSGADVVFGNATGPGTDGLTATQFAGGKYLSVTLPTTPTAVECYFSTTTTPASMSPILGSPAGLLAGIGVFSDGKLHSSGGADLTSPVVTGGATHHLVWELGHVYLDGVDIGSPTDIPIGAQVSVGGCNAAVPFTGTIAHVAVRNSTLSAARAAAHSQAGLTGFAGESGTARITRLAGYAGVSLGTLDTSLTNVAFEDITGKKLMDAIRDVADAEMGLAYFNGSGSLEFHNRNRVAAKTAPDVTIDANFLAEGTRFEYDMQGVLNYLKVTAQGTSVTQVARNVASEVTNKHGRYDADKTYLVQTDREALDRGNWVVATHAEPAARIGSLVIDVLTMTAAQQASMLAVEPDTWLRVTGLPGQTVGGTTADFIVQGIAPTVSATEWTLTLNAANQPARYPTPWILGDTTWSVLGSTTKLYV
jgi:hypothetical protein